MNTNAPPDYGKAESYESYECIDVESDRFSPEMKGRHIARYLWACDVIKNRFVRAGNVIDFASGTGYGAEI